MVRTLQILLLIIIGCSFVSCGERQKNISVSLDSFSNLRESDYVIDVAEVSDDLKRVVLADRDFAGIDRLVRRYYLNDGGFMWVTQSGVSPKADSVLAYIDKVEEMGFNRECFGYSRIKKDIIALRQLDFRVDDVNTLMARLEYNLTKAFFRYCIGQRFGFMNPREVFNRIDVRDSDSIHVSYRSLYGVKIKTADKSFFDKALNAIHNNDSVGLFLAESKPSNPVYYKLLDKFKTTSSRSMRNQLLCNMERCRWEQKVYPQNYDKYVLVNIPSMHLVAVDGEKQLSMRIGLGSMETKTPLLNSRIKRMDFNPQWIIPKSIIKKSIRQHAGNKDYFEKHNYFIRERATGKIVDPSVATGELLCSNDYMVIQRGGRNNALGRVIFRFDNDYSIYLHDTSNPGVFSRSDRSVSHGCIRVEKPFDLAVFMLADKNERLIEKMKYSMTVDYDTHPQCEEDQTSKINMEMMIKSQIVSPEIPLFMTYYTLYLDIRGQLIEYPDVYGYDAVVLDCLKRFMR